MEQLAKENLELVHGNFLKYDKKKVNEVYMQ